MRLLDFAGYLLALGWFFNALMWVCMFVGASFAIWLTFTILCALSFAAVGAICWYDQRQYR